MDLSSPCAAFGVFSLSRRAHPVNSTPCCSGHAGGMADRMREGAAEPRKGEGRCDVFAQRIVARRGRARAGGALVQRWRGDNRGGKTSGTDLSSPCAAFGVFSLSHWEREGAAEPRKGEGRSDVFAQRIVARRGRARVGGPLVRRRPGDSGDGKAEGTDLSSPCAAFGVFSLSRREREGAAEPRKGEGRCDVFAQRIVTRRGRARAGGPFWPRRSFSPGSRSS